MPKNTKKKKTTTKTKKPKSKKVVKEVKVKKTTDEKKEVTPKVKLDYIFSVGRRKSSVARVRFYKKGEGEIIINEKELKVYFPQDELQQIVMKPLEKTSWMKKGKFTIKVHGGGIRGQADSISLGISRILLMQDSGHREILKSNKLLTRDPRVKERKKYGLKKARRAPQWQKR